MGDELYGFGLMVDRTDGKERIWHNGGINGFNSVLSWWPDLGLRIAVISNSDGLPSGTVADRIAAELTSAKPLPPLRSAPQPGAKAALLDLVAGLAAGKPDYAALTPQLAELTRTQLPALQRTLQQLGSIKSVTFRGVNLGGADQYVAHFANGALLFTISLDSEKKINLVALMPIQQTKGP